MKKLTMIALTMSAFFNISVAFAQETKTVFTFKVGDEEVSLLSEGEREGSTDIIIGATQERLQRMVPDGFTSAINAFLVRSAGKNILIDTGIGRNLFDNLASLSVSAEQIDAVLITHGHGDHIGGLLQNGQASFPNAVLYLSQPEYDFWMSDEMMNQAEEGRRGGFQGVRDVVSVYKERLQLFNSDGIGTESEMLLPGIQGVAAYGHTPGHTLFMIGSSEQKLLVWGDLTHVMPVQMPYPELAVTYDVDPKQAVESRLKVLEYISKNNIPVAGMHIAYPAMGNVKENSEKGGYEFIPLK
ncbi:MAG: MBL fold metallo-hydrolase [Bacteroidales bacterium]|nr:MBL fold metallo-hydrolase [Bacteroidales bacterium]